MLMIVVMVTVASVSLKFAAGTSEWVGLAVISFVYRVGGLALSGVALRLLGG